MRLEAHRLLVSMVVGCMLVAASCAGGGRSAMTVSGEGATGSTAAASTVATSTAPGSSTTVSTISSAESIEELVVDGALDVEVISPSGGVSGEILDVVLANGSDEDVDATIPCGLVFEPAPGVEEQRMMVIQPVEASVPAGSSVTVHPYVVCIDSDEDPAAVGAVYGPAGRVEGELLSFAQCLCARDVDKEIDAAMGGMDVQFATWAVADGFLPSWNGNPGDLAGALGNLTGESLDLDAEDLQELQGAQLDQIVGAMQVFMEQFGTAAQRWLDECGVDLSK